MRIGFSTGLYTVLMEADDPHEPIADAVRSLTDGHIHLSRQLAEQAHYPAIDVLSSVSRLRTVVTSQVHQRRVSESSNCANDARRSFNASKP